MKSKRKIIINGDTYKYIIGKGNVVIWAPNKKKIVVDFSTLTGRSWDAIERGQWKNTRDGMITPKDIANYIQG